jgi:protein-disulfide isomerase
VRLLWVLTGLFACTTVAMIVLWHQARDGAYWRGFEDGVREGMERGKKLAPPPVNRSDVRADLLAEKGLPVPVPSSAFMEALNRAPSPCADLVEAGVSLASCLTNADHLAACPSCVSQAELLASQTTAETGADWLVDRARREQRLAVPDTLGAEAGGGTVVVAVFTDYQCPFCARLKPTLDELVTRDPRVRLQIFQYPLKAIHQAAEAAAWAALAAERQGAFSAMESALFERQRQLEDLAAQTPPFAELARALSLDLERFAQDMKDPQIAARVEQEIDAARALDVRGTPTVLVDGVLHTGSRGVEALMASVDAAIQRRENLELRRLPAEAP